MFRDSARTSSDQTPQYQGAILHDHKDLSRIVSNIWNIDVTNNEYYFLFNKI